MEQNANVARPGPADRGSNIRAGGYLRPDPAGRKRRSNFDQIVLRTGYENRPVLTKRITDRFLITSTMNNTSSPIPARSGRVVGT